MHPTYEAVYEDGQLQWIDEQPGRGRHRVLVTILREEGGEDAQRADARQQVLHTMRGSWGRASIEAIDAVLDEDRNAWDRPERSAS